MSKQVGILSKQIWILTLSLIVSAVSLSACGLSPDSAKQAQGSEQGSTTGSAHGSLIRSESGSGAIQSSVFDRVARSGTLRCGYIVYPPYCLKDPNTKRLSGVFVEAMEAAGKKLGWKIVWAREVGYGTLFEELAANKIDVFAGGLWANAQRAKAGEFTQPLFYNVIKVYGRTNETRFQHSLDEINSPSVTIATLDGAMEDLIAKEDFPKAKCLSLPQLSDFSQNLVNITTKKADLTFAEPVIVDIFLKNNPHSLKALEGDKPIRVFGNCYVVKAGETRLRDVLNITMQELINSGQIEKILKKYEPAPGAFYRVAPPYQVPHAVN